METFDLIEPNEQTMQLLSSLEKIGFIKVTVIRAAHVEVVSKLLVPGSVKEAVEVVEKKKSRWVGAPRSNAQFSCPKCGQRQRKSRHGDVCWRCQKKADEVGDPQHVKNQEIGPMFAAGAGVQVSGDGYIKARKLG